MAGIIHAYSRILSAHALSFDTDRVSSNLNEDTLCMIPNILFVSDRCGSIAALYIFANSMQPSIDLNSLLIKCSISNENPPDVEKVIFQEQDLMDINNVLHSSLIETFLALCCSIGITICEKSYPVINDSLLLFASDGSESDTETLSSAFERSKHRKVVARAIITSIKSLLKSPSGRQITVGSPGLARNLYRLSKNDNNYPDLSTLSMALKISSLNLLDTISSAELCYMMASANKTAKDIFCGEPVVSSSTPAQSPPALHKGATHPIALDAAVAFSMILGRQRWVEVEQQGLEWHGRKHLDGIGQSSLGGNYNLNATSNHSSPKCTKIICSEPAVALSMCYLASRLFNLSPTAEQLVQHLSAGGLFGYPLSVTVTCSKSSVASALTFVRSLPERCEESGDFPPHCLWFVTRDIPVRAEPESVTATIPFDTDEPDSIRGDAALDVLTFYSS